MKHLTIQAFKEAARREEERYNSALDMLRRFDNGQGVGTRPPSDKLEIGKAPRFSK